MKFYMILIIIAVLLFVFTAWIVHKNYTNNKIIEIFATSIVLGIGITLLSITFILKPEKTESSFISSVTVLHDSHNINLQELASYDNMRNNKNFPSIPYSSHYLNVKQFYYQEHPEAFEVDKGDLKPDIYKEILVYSIINDLFQSFSRTWTADVEYIEGPTGLSIHTRGEAKSKSKIVSWSFFSEKIPYPIFKNFNPSAVQFPKNAQLHVPMGTKIDVTPEELGISLTMENNEMRMSVKVEWLGGARSAGEIGSLLNIPFEDRDKFATYTYKISFTSEIKKWSSGHPNAELYRKWFDTIKLNLEHNYSYDKYLKEAKEWYLLYSNR